MIEVFTKAIVREIGRNYGKAASNKLLGDAHSTPYRRVSGKQGAVVLGASTGGTKYDNQLDRLIRTFQIKGKLATFNSAQNIYNEYFKLVEEAKADNNVNYSEALYLVDQYNRVLFKLKEISKALLELDAKDKSQLVLYKIISLNEFMKELDNNFEIAPLMKQEVDKKQLKNSIVFAMIAVVLAILLIVIWISKEFYLSQTMKWVVGWFMLFSFIFSWSNSKNYRKKKQLILDDNHKIELIIKLKKEITKAVNSIKVSEI